MINHKENVSGQLRIILIDSCESSLAAFYKLVPVTLHRSATNTFYQTAPENFTAVYSLMLHVRMHAWNSTSKARCVVINTVELPPCTSLITIQSANNACMPVNTDVILFDTFNYHFCHVHLCNAYD